MEVLPLTSRASTRGSLDGYRTRRSFCAPHSRIFPESGRFLNSSSLISFDHLRSSMKIESICDPMRRSSASNIDSLLKDKERLSKFIEPMSDHMPSTTTHFE